METLIFEMISREIIKPSSPTPDHLRTYRLSLFDQLAPPLYASIVLFYQPNHPVVLLNHDQLKTSLSKTLTHFYPLAGQFKDNLTINCNDHGASYVQAKVACNLSGFPDTHLQPHQLVQLLPFHPLEASVDPLDQVILGFQISTFACGGIAVGACIWHSVSDASALVSFLSTWASVAIDHGHGVHISGAVADCYSLFPAKELPTSSDMKGEGAADEDDPWANMLTNKFVFERTKIDSLRGKLGNVVRAAGDRGPTRVEALIAFLWGAMVAIDEEEKKRSCSSLHVGYCNVTVNFRKRLEPPLSPHCIGNNIVPALLKWPVGLPWDYDLAARKIREVIRGVDDGFIRKLYSDDDFINKRLPNVGDDDHHQQSLVPVVKVFSSICGVPFDKMDFGFGKPYQVAPVLSAKNLTILVDAQDGGGGVEAWIALSKEDMAMFEKDPAILEYTTFTPSSSS